MIKICRKSIDKAVCQTTSDTKTLQMDTGCQITSNPKLSRTDARRLTVYHKKLSVNAYIQLFCDKNSVFKARNKNLSKAPIAFCISYLSKDSFKYGIYMFSSTVFSTISKFVHTLLLPSHSRQGKKVLYLRFS